MAPPVESVLLWEELDVLVECGLVESGPTRELGDMLRFTTSARRGLTIILKVFVEDVLLSVGMMAAR